ncbi:MAG: Crp/Fnr family transcriptional regulator [Vicinamibacterales bacterium]
MFERLRRQLLRYATLTDQEFDGLVALLKVRRVEKGSPVLAPGEICGFEGFVATGCLRVYFCEADGSERVLYFAPEGWWVTDIESFVSERPAALGIDAVETSELLVIDKPSIDLLRRQVPTSERMFRALTDHTLVTLQRRIVASMRKTATQRYLEFVEQYPGLELRIPQYHIAAYLGVSAEFLSKLRKKLVARRR